MVGEHEGDVVDFGADGRDDGHEACTLRVHNTYADICVTRARDGRDGGHEACGGARSSRYISA